MSGIPVSKVLVLDESAAHASCIKEFCEANNLVALKVSRTSVMGVLSTNIDLGGILYSESFAGSPDEMSRLASAIHRARPELPIIIRRDSTASLAGLPPLAQSACCAAYVAQDMDGLRRII